MAGARRREVKYAVNVFIDNFWAALKCPNIPTFSCLHSVAGQLERCKEVLTEPSLHDITQVLHSLNQKVFDALALHDDLLILSKAALCALHQDQGVALIERWTSDLRNATNVKGMGVPYNDAKDAERADAKASEDPEKESTFPSSGKATHEAPRNIATPIVQIEVKASVQRGTDQKAQLDKEAKVQYSRAETVRDAHHQTNEEQRMKDQEASEQAKKDEMDQYKRAETYKREMSERQTRRSLESTKGWDAIKAANAKEWKELPGVLEAAKGLGNLCDLLPWPTPSGLHSELNHLTVLEFVREVVEKGVRHESARQKLLRAELLRWHPDKIMGRYQGWLGYDDVLKAAALISKALNARKDAIPQTPLSPPRAKKRSTQVRPRPWTGRKWDGRYPGSRRWEPRSRDSEDDDTSSSSSGDEPEPKRRRHANGRFARMT
ncbi:hypothetical protein LTR66_006808 [Elasticomyces elasticus]|nr:hypothetical protein LTR28_003644 [Elasticomyces elasticus]KAK4990432.1 hypothetical protein LTR66_006808 [Elasticomyces elasticus]